MGQGITKQKTANTTANSKNKYLQQNKCPTEQSQTYLTNHN